MNNIEILENFINKVDIYFNDDIGDCAITSKIAGIIKNLIQENKKLSWKYENAKDMYIIKESSINENYIPKSKLKGIVELYDNTLQCTRKYNKDLADILCDLEELLGEN